MTSTIAFVNAGAPQQNNSSPLSPALPTNHAAGDLMLLICEQTSAAGITFTPPAGTGWVSIARNDNATRAMTLEVFAKVEEAGEGAPSTACSSAAGGWQTCIVNYRNVNNVIVEDVADVPSDAAAAATWQPTGISLSTAGDMVLSVVASKDDNALALSVTNGYTVRVSGATYDGTTGNGSDYSLGLAEQLFGTTGAKTCPTWSQTANGNDAWIGLTIALLAANPVPIAPGAAAITIDTATPMVAVGANVLVQPDAAAVTVGMATPTIGLPILVQPDAASITLGTATPAVGTPIGAAPGAAAIGISTGTPTISATQTYVPGAVSIAVGTATPALSATQTYRPAAATISVSTATPSISAGAATGINPAPAALTIGTATPSVVAALGVRPAAAALAMAGAVPAVAAGKSASVQPSPASVRVTGARPTVRTNQVIPLPAPAFVARPIRVPRDVRLRPRPVNLAVVGAVPHVVIGDDFDVATLLVGL